MEGKLMEIRYGINGVLPEEEHKSDTLVKEGIWVSCKDEIFINLEDINLYRFVWKNYKEFNNLVYIYLKKNKLEKIDGEIFSVFPNLYWLDLSENQLKSFPKEVKGHPNLDTILLENNKISHLPIELGSLLNLNGLTIFGNPIKFPNTEILDLTEKELLNYLKRCWESQAHDLPLFKPKIKGKHLSQAFINKNFKAIEDAGEFVSRNWKSRETINQVLADTLVKNIEAQNDILQKRKDEECLREWRDRYKANTYQPIIKSIDAPPFGTYEQYAKMPNRKDINIPLISGKPRVKIGKPRKKRHEYLTSELKRIQETMDRIRSAHVPSSLDEKSIHEAMSTRIQEIKALRDIQKRVNELRLKN